MTPRVYVRALSRCCFHSLVGMMTFWRALTSSVDMQMLRDKDCPDCPFSGVTRSGRVWRKGAGKRGLECVCAAEGTLECKN